MDKILNNLGLCNKARGLVSGEEIVCEVCEAYSSFELSSAIGKVGRMVIGITNESFIKILKK